MEIFGVWEKGEYSEEDADQARSREARAIDEWIFSIRRGATRYKYVEYGLLGLISRSHDDQAEITACPQTQKDRY
jgi:hypothetical protein